MVGKSEGVDVGEKVEGGAGGVEGKEEAGSGRREREEKRGCLNGEICRGGSWRRGRSGKHVDALSDSRQTTERPKFDVLPSFPQGGTSNV